MAGTKSKGTIKPKNEKFTAVVYFHGMGEQKRYEESSRLVDSLERYGRNNGTKIPETSIHADVELSHVDEERSVGYVNVTHGNRGYRFYEAYWANITAGGISSQDVLIWMLKQVSVPFKAMFLAQWREMSHLKRAVFLENIESLKKRRGDNATDDDARYILKLFEKFDSTEGRIKYPRGSFSNFLDSIRKAIPDGEDPGGAREERVTHLAWAWLWKFVWTQVRSLIILLTIVLALLLVGVAAIALIGALTGYIGEFGEFSGLDGTKSIWTKLSDWIVLFIGAKAIEVTWFNVLLFITAIGVAFYGNYFFQNFMGDVYYWVTYEESSTKHLKRLEILETCGNALRQVLKNDDCDRIIIVAHSLGTTIAYDTLLELARYNKAVKGKQNLPLKRITDIITLASPIDKISYFFENQRSRYYQYLRVVDEIRGNISAKPFVDNNGKTRIHWYNFWDQADIIGGSLQAIGGATEIYPNIDNIQVRSFLFPEPGAAHSAYFENKHVVGSIYQIIFDPNSVHKYETPPKLSLGMTIFFQVLIMLLPWLFALYVLWVKLNEVAALSISAESILYAALSLGGFLVLFYIFSRFLQGHMDKLSQ